MADLDGSHASWSAYLRLNARNQKDRTTYRNERAFKTRLVIAGAKLIELAISIRLRPDVELHKLGQIWLFQDKHLTRGYRLFPLPRIPVPRFFACPD